MGTLLQFKDFQDFWRECSSKAACYQPGLTILGSHSFKNSILHSQTGLAETAGKVGGEGGRGTFRARVKGLSCRSQSLAEMDGAQRSREMQAHKDELSHSKPER